MTALALRISDALARYGYEALTASDEAEAVAIIKADRRVGVVVADVEAGGLGLAKAARNVRADIGVVYTAATPHQIPDREKVSGAPVLRTPYGAHQLAGLISGLGKQVLDEPLAA